MRHTSDGSAEAWPPDRSSITCSKVAADYHPVVIGVERDGLEESAAQANALVTYRRLKEKLDRYDAVLAERFHTLRLLYSADQAFSDRTIVRFAARQQNRDQAPFSICECMDLRVAPSARAANSLLLLPPLAPAAERWALMCVESIICVWIDRPFPASSRNRLSQTPRLAQRTKRL